MRIIIAVFLMVALSFAKKPTLNNNTDLETRESEPRLSAPHRQHRPYKNNNEKTAKIVKQDYEINLDGSYRYGYETSNGIVSEQSGKLERAPSGKLAEEVQGQSVYTAPNNKIISLTYHAGVEGYLPEGDHLPTSPPASRIVKQLVDYLTSLPKTTDGESHIIKPKPKPTGTAYVPKNTHGSDSKPLKGPLRPESSKRPVSSPRQPSRKPNTQKRPIN